MVEAFRMFDKGDKGYTTPSEIEVVLTDMSVPFFANDISMLFARCCAKGDGKLRFSDF